MKQAVVAIEDSASTSTAGSTSRGSARALYQDILSGSTQQGASTITQQFVKNALAAQDSRTILQKFREAAIAYHLERQWSKDKILTEYLNEIYFGEGATGIEAAARTYFGSDPDHAGCGQGEGSDPCASELYPWEAALLAGIISSPSAYSPRANPDRREGAARPGARPRWPSRATSPPRRPPTTRRSRSPTSDDILPPSEDSEAPYFTSWLRQQLVDRYGAGEAFGGGLRIQSTLDLDLQRAVESLGLLARRRHRPDLLGGRARQRHRGGAGDGRRVRLPEGAVQPRHQRPAPARIGVQAVHADHGARGGALHQRGLRLGDRARSRSRSR